MYRRPLPLAIVVSATLFAACHFAVSGTQMRVFYGNEGLWWGTADADVTTTELESGAVQILHGGTWLDLGSGSDTWVYQAVRWVDATGATVQLDAGTTVDDYSATTLTVPGRVGTRFVYRLGDVTLTRSETWATGGTAINVDVTLTNAGAADVTDAVFVHGFDVADVGSGALDTVNDSVDIDGDGLLDWAESRGASTVAPFTLGFGACDPAATTLGHGDDTSDIDKPLADDGGVGADRPVHVRQAIGTVPAGGSVRFGYVVGVGATDTIARAAYTDALPFCAGCDEDADGHGALACGGDDCDDTDAAVVACPEEDPCDSATEDTDPTDTGPDDTATVDTGSDDTATVDTGSDDTATPDTTEDTATPDTATPDTATDDTLPEATDGDDTGAPEAPEAPGCSSAGGGGATLLGVLVALAGGMRRARTSR